MKKKKRFFTIVARGNQEGEAITDHCLGKTYRGAVRQFINERKGQDLCILDVFQGALTGLLPSAIYTRDIKE